MCHGGHWNRVDPHNPRDAGRSTVHLHTVDQCVPRSTHRFRVSDGSALETSE